jgi:hypothetical protein
MSLEGGRALAQRGRFRFAALRPVDRAGRDPGLRPFPGIMAPARSRWRPCSPLAVGAAEQARDRGMGQKVPETVGISTSSALICGIPGTGVRAGRVAGA